MASDPGFVAHCSELLAPLGPVRARRMFGGTGFDVDGHFLAVIVDDRLFLKTDDATAAAFDAEGAVPFAYDGPRGRVTTRYRSAPDAALESAQAMRPWARLALEAALRAEAARTRASPRAAPAKTRRAAASKAG